MERLVRIFEMTYLDLKDNLQLVLQEKNMVCRPKQLKQNVKINELGQIIAEEH